MGRNALFSVTVDDVRNTIRIAPRGELDGAAVPRFDDVVRACETCREANPFVAPFVRRGQVLTLAAGEAFDAGVMTLAAKMKGSDHVWARRTWWLVPAALSVGHTIAARHNSNLLK